MPSKAVTILLAAFAIVFGTLAGVQLVQNDLPSFFGSPPRQVGDELYTWNIEEVDVQAVTISNSTGETVRVEKRSGVWFVGDPINDRADYRDIQRLVFFTRHLRIEDVLRRSETTLEETGMREVGGQAGRFKLEFEDSTGTKLAEYRLGRRTAWYRVNEKTGDSSETFFVRPSETGQKVYFYVCSAPEVLKPNVRQILERGFNRLRDHRPFLFYLQETPDGLLTDVADISIKYRGGEIALSRPNHVQPWRMTKPLEALTKPDAIRALLQGLHDLEASNMHNRDAVTIAPAPSGDPYLEISMRLFNEDGQRQKHAATLTVQDAPAENADTVYATMDLVRPGSVFELPLKPSSGKASLSELPLSVDELRSRTLASIDINHLRYVTIHAQNRRQPIQLYLHVAQNTGQPRWLMKNGTEVSPANEIAFHALLRAVRTDEVIGFASDAASNLADYGLNPPHKRLTIQEGEDKITDLLFGRGTNGKFYAMRRGESTVAEIGSGTYSAIATASIAWRDTLLMPFSIVDLAAMRIEWPVRPPLQNPVLTLNYGFLDESWTARQFGEDATARLNVLRANKFIEFMEGLRVEKWLGPEVAKAESVLRNPVYRFAAVFRETNEDGDQTGVRQETFEIAPASNSPVNQYYYGRLGGDPNYFLLSLDSVKVLAVDLLDAE